MDSESTETATYLFIAISGSIIALTAAIIGWLQVFRVQPQGSKILHRVSLFALLCASFAILMAAATWIWTAIVHGQTALDTYYDMAHSGILLAFLAILFASIGLAGKSSFRWYALLSALGIFAFWWVVQPFP